jgi:hypothetical protein
VKDAPINWARVIAELASEALNAPKKHTQHHRDKALVLLEQCQERDIAPPTELIELISAFIGDDRRNAYPSLSATGLGRVGDGREADYILRILATDFGVTTTHYPKLMAAAKFEAEHDPDPEGKKSSTASYNQISKAVGIGRPTVRNYQKKEKYRALVEELRAERLKGVNVP